MPKLLSLTLASFAVAVSAGSQPASANDAPKRAAEPTSEVKLLSDVEWEQLNPARGSASPKAGTLWGDRNGTGPTGFLVEFVDGFSSPPHIHNVSYRGVVISGLVHNDDPDAAHMWMPPGSFWTQPKGEVHITAAGGSRNVAYIEIEEGPYLVLPREEAFDSGERPINVDESNLVWLDAGDSDRSRTPTSADKPEVTFLWGAPQEGQLNGTMVKLPAGFTGEIRSHGLTFRTVVVRGEPRYRMSGQSNVETLEPGSSFSSRGESVHQVSSAAEDCVIYVRTDGKFDVVPAHPKK